MPRMQNGSYVAMTTCFYCGEGNEILLHMRMSNVFPDHGKIGVTSLRPCSKCEDYMKQGVLLISFDESKTDFNDTLKLPNPEKKRKSDHHPDTVDTGTPNFYRTGGWCVVRDDAVERMPIERKFIDRALKQRVLFLPDQVWDAFGLPRGEYDPEASTKGKTKMHYADCRHAKKGNTTSVPEEVTCKLCIKRKEKENNGVS